MSHKGMGERERCSLVAVDIDKDGRKKEFDEKQKN